MTIEDKLKELIITKYGNLSNFSKEVDMPNSTLATIMKNGIHKANVTNIIKICKSLGISTDELAKNRIVPVKTNQHNEFKMKEMRDVFKFIELNLKTNKGCTIDGCPLDKGDVEILLDMVDMAFEIIRRKKEREHNR